MRNRIFAAIILSVAATAYGSNETALIPRRVLFAPPDRGSIKLSTDGKRIAFLASGALWTASVADMTKREKRIDGPVANYEWAFTGQHIVYRKDNRVFSFNLETGATRDLAEGQIAKLSPRIPNEVLVASNSEHPDLFRVNIMNGESRPVLQNPTYDQFYADFDFRPRVAIREASDGGYELSTQNGEGKWSVIYTIPLAAALVSHPVGVDGNGNVLYVVDNQNRDKAALKSIDLRTGKIRVLASSALADIAPSILFNPRTGVAESVSAPYARTTRLYVNDALRNDFNFLNSVAPGDVGVAGRSMDDNVWLVAYLNGGPPRYYAYDRRSHRATFLLTEYDALEPYKLARREMVTYTTRDGIKLPGDLYWPPWVSTSRNAHLPMVIVVHGGPNAAYPWNSWTTNQMLQLLANRGYLAFRVEFRGVAGLGKNVLNAGNGEWGRKMNDDLVDAADWAAAQGFADRDHVGVMGWSYGGYAAVAALTFSPDAFACGVAMYPVTDLVALIQTRDPFIQPIWRGMVGDERTAEGRALLEARSPVHFADRVKKPLLITHGMKDDNVAPSHSEEEVKALKAAGKDVTFVPFADEGHDYAQPKNLISFFGTVEEFLASHLGGRVEVTPT